MMAMEQLLTDLIEEIRGLRSDLIKIPPECELLNMDEAAEFLRISPPHFKHYWREWGIPSVQMGARIVFRRETLRDWAKRREGVMP